MDIQYNIYTEFKQRKNYTQADGDTQPQYRVKNYTHIYVNMCFFRHTFVVA